jgi:ABC-type uncharacterized transport system permease subunit
MIMKTIFAAILSLGSFAAFANFNTTPRYINQVSTGAAVNGYAMGQNTVGVQNVVRQPVLGEGNGDYCIDGRYATTVIRNDGTTPTPVLVPADGIH